MNTNTVLTHNWRIEDLIFHAYDDVSQLIYYYNCTGKDIINFILDYLCLKCFVQSTIIIKKFFTIISYSYFLVQISFIKIFIIIIISFNLIDWSTDKKCKRIVWQNYLSNLNLNDLDTFKLQIRIIQIQLH